jgi:hypothetical protein
VGIGSVLASVDGRLQLSMLLEELPPEAPVQILHRRLKYALRQLTLSTRCTLQ